MELAEKTPPIMRGKKNMIVRIRNGYYILFSMSAKGCAKLNA